MEEAAQIVSSTADTRTEVEEKKEEKKLGSLTAVESVLNDYAKKFAKRHRVPEDGYTIILSTDFSRGIMGIVRGPVAQIVLLWPHAQPNINTLLDDAFRMISRNHLVDSFAVESSIVIKRRAEERRRWVREKIGDQADIILDLIPKHRIRTRVITTVEYEDVITKEKISITHSQRPEQYRGQDISNWLKLSRLVRDNHPEEATRYVDESEFDTSTAAAIVNDTQSCIADDGRSGIDAAIADMLDRFDAFGNVTLGRINFTEPDQAH